MLRSGAIIYTGQQHWFLLAIWNCRADAPPVQLAISLTDGVINGQRDVQTSKTDIDDRLRQHIH